MVTHPEHAQADGILRYMLDKGHASRKQVAWLLGYLRRLRLERGEPQDSRNSKS